MVEGRQECSRVRTGFCCFSSVNMSTKKEDPKQAVAEGGGPAEEEQEVDEEEDEGDEEDGAQSGEEGESEGEEEGGEGGDEGVISVSSGSDAESGDEVLIIGESDDGDGEDVEDDEDFDDEDDGSSVEGPGLAAIYADVCNC